jgi:hypothetical protein
VRGVRGDSLARRCKLRVRARIAEDRRPVVEVEVGPRERPLGTGRIEAFSDGIFAIAITLLVLEIGVPESDFENLWKGIADQWPSYLGYATSFLTVGGLWVIHHGIFRRLASADAMVMRLNILLLMLVSFLPFPPSSSPRPLTSPAPSARPSSSTVLFFSRSPS